MMRRFSKWGFVLSTAALLVATGCGGDSTNGSKSTSSDSSDSGNGGSTADSSSSCHSDAIVTDYSVCVGGKYWYCSSNDTNSKCADGDCSHCTEDECQEPCS